MAGNGPGTTQERKEPRVNLGDIAADVQRADQDTGDPAPSSTVLPTERAQQIVRNISATALDEISKLRDELDDLMRAVKKREDVVMGVVQDFARFSEEAIRCKLVIADSVVGLRKSFEEGVPRISPSRTISQ